MTINPKLAFASTYPTFIISSVETDEHVTIYTNNFPANKNFKVLMGEYGTLGVNGIEVATVNSGSGGSFYGTFQIPEELVGRAIIAIRLQGSDNPFYAFNWFYNKVGGSSGGELPGYSGIPLIYIQSVEKDSKVTIKTQNFPKNLDFDVLMGKMWTQGISGIKVDTINSGDGGSFELTFDIPEDLHGEQRIAIRLQSASGYYSYNWFWNNDAPGGFISPGYSGFPKFMITAVEKDNKVSIKAQNLPADMKFDVLMGKMWTQGINGNKVTTIESEEGGEREFTFEIPEALHGESRISIRLESASGYYAYNWFWNNTYP
jgi:hypothetical protein